MKAILTSKRASDLERALELIFLSSKWGWNSFAQAFDAYPIPNG